MRCEKRTDNPLNGREERLDYRAKTLRFLKWQRDWG